LKKQVSALANGGSGVVTPASPDSRSETTGGEYLHPKGISTWMGCDESGKGDVFGPLCAAACTITADEQQLLRQIGVCDSKMLDDKKIAKLASAIKTLLKDRCTVQVIMPCEYNRLYDTMKMNHQNLNHLLGSVHAQNIRVLLSKHDCPCIIVDKFGKDEYVLAGLKDLISTHQIIQVTKGERDIAVAAASILARQAFVQAMEELSHTYDMTFPKGAWLGIKTAIHAFSCRYGEEQLNHVGKLNFKNFDFLRG
jgi:ribonuclease HIII